MADITIHDHSHRVPAHPDHHVRAVLSGEKHDTVILYTPTGTAMLAAEEFMEIAAELDKLGEGGL